MFEVEDINASVKLLCKTFYLICVPWQNQCPQKLAHRFMFYLFIIKINVGINGKMPNGYKKLIH